MSYSKNSIQKRIKERLKNPASAIEGTFTMDNTQAVAQELAEIHNTEIEPILGRVSIFDATGADLDRCVRDYYEERKLATAAVGKLQFSGSARTYIPAGTLARFDSLLYRTDEAVRIDASGQAIVPATCQQVGAVGNLDAGFVNSMVTALDGITDVTNPVPFEGGTDDEDDEALRGRVIDKNSRPITSGNEAYYEYHALQVPGVGAARCIGCKYGPGTAQVILLSSEGTTPDSIVMANAKEYVEAQALIGVDLTFTPARPLTINLQGTIRLKGGYLIEEVQQGIFEQLESYFSTIAFDNETEYLSYYKVIELVAKVAGVDDILTLEVNGGEVAVPIGEDEFCVVGSVNVDAG